MKGNKTRKSKLNIDQAVATTIATRIVSLLNRRETGTWEGTMSDLNRAITTGRNQIENWPGSPSVLRRVVNYIRPVLTKAGVRINFSRTSDHMRTRLVTFSQR
jgi:hypothetical protein